MENAQLVRLFKRTGVVSGPSRLKTRHSDLSTIKTWLIGDSVSFGYRGYHNFGSAVHYNWLIEKKGNFKLTDEEARTASAMLTALRRHPIATKLLASCPIREQRLTVTLNGVRVGFTPDARGRKIVIDLKTTVCRTLKDFIQKAFEYGYFRQGRQYGLGTQTNEYYIIGIQKQPPYQVFIVWLQSPEFKDWLDYVNEELKFLLYFYQNYGTPNYKR